MKHKDLLIKAAASGIMVASSPMLDEMMENLESRAQPFIAGIKAGTHELLDVTNWLRSGRCKSLSAWQCEEVAQYIESECRE